MKKAFEKVAANIIVGVGLYTIFGVTVWILSSL